MTREKRGDLKGINVAAFESRQKDAVARLIEGIGGNAFVAPSLQEVPLEDQTETYALGERLAAGAIDFLILMTGVGTRTLLQVLSTRYRPEQLREFLKNVVLVSRGPKPAAALAANGLSPTIAVPEPNTWREILKTLDASHSLEKKTVAVQEYGEINRLFLAELAARGAEVFSVPVYRAALPEDTGPMAELMRRIIKGDMNVVLFTNSAQVENVLGLARKEGIAQEFHRALSNTIVGSVGPSCSTALRERGLRVDYEPARPMMGALVAGLAAEYPNLLSKKQQSIFRGTSEHKAPRLNDPLLNSLFLRACRKEPVERTPVWLMRQAGRYMKEYRELRAKISFLDLCKNSDLSAEVTVDAAHRLGVDAAIIFSDILLVVEPLGFSLSYGKDEGPEIGSPFREEKDLDRLRIVDVHESLGFVLSAIRKTRAALRKDLPLIGFVGAPFTLASYMIEGKGSRNFLLTKKIMYEAPAVWNRFLEKITDALIDFAAAQVEAGVQAFQVFDSWVGCLSPEDYRNFVLPHSRRLIQGVPPGIPVIHFGTQTTGLLPLIKQAGGDVIGVDWRVELDEAWEILGDVAIQGNLDPVVLLSEPAEIRARAKRILSQAGGRSGHIFNLGHGVLPATPIENVLELVRAVAEMSARK